MFIFKQSSKDQLRQCFLRRLSPSCDCSRDIWSSDTSAESQRKISCNASLQALRTRMGALSATDQGRHRPCPTKLLAQRESPSPTERRQRQGIGTKVVMVALHWPAETDVSGSDQDGSSKRDQTPNASSLNLSTKSCQTLQPYLAERNVLAGTVDGHTRARCVRRLVRPRNNTRRQTSVKRY